MTPDDLAKVRPIDIRDQAHFDQLLAAIPQPIPNGIWRAQYNRLNAIAHRHGFDWPYKRRTKKHHGQPEHMAKGWGIVGVREPVGNDRGQSANHVADVDGYEYYTRDTYLYKADLRYGLDADGYRRNGELVARYHEIATYMESIR